MGWDRAGRVRVGSTPMGRGWLFASTPGLVDGGADWNRVAQGKWAASGLVQDPAAAREQYGN